LTRAIDLADAETSSDELNDARCLLTFADLESGDYYAAVVIGEELAHTAPKFRDAASAAIYALRAYAALISKDEEAGTSPGGLAAKRARLEQLARYIEAQWPGSVAADAARHVLGVLYLSTKRYADAVQVMERIGPGYKDSARAYHHLALAAWQ